MSSRNGHPKPPNLRELTTERKRLEESIRVSQLRRVARLSESYYDNQNVVADLFNRYKDANGVWTPVTTTRGDRRSGANYPLFRSEAELDRYRAESRVIAATNSYAQGLLEGLTSYVISTGYTFRANAKKGFDRNASKAAVAEVQAAIDKFLEYNQFEDLCEELYWRSQEDGEYFLRHTWNAEHGCTEMRTVEPEQVVTPMDLGGYSSEEWSFGLRHYRDDAGEDVQRILEANVRYWNGTQEVDEVVPMDQLVHCKINKRSIKRGMPVFTFQVAHSLDCAARLRRNMGETACVNAATAEIWQHSKGTADQIQALATGFTDPELQRTDAVTGRQHEVSRVHPGLVRHVTKGMELADIPGAKASTAYTGYVEALQALLRGAGVRWNAPEWLTSGLHDTSSFASSLTAESPFVIRVKRAQRLYRAKFKESISIALRQAVDNGELSQATLDQVDVQVEAPVIQVRDTLRDAQVDQIYGMARVKSPQTTRQQLGLDNDQESQNWREWDEENGPALEPLEIPNGDPGIPAPPT